MGETVANRARFRNDPCRGSGNPKTRDPRLDDPAGGAYITAMTVGPHPSSAQKLLENLTGPQQEAVSHTDGPLCVLAAAGSGKTRVITRRAAYLAATVTRARSVLAITFTNKAANEMKERIAALGVDGGMTICTFHSLCARLLRIHHERAGLAPNFTIFDTDDQRKVIKEAVAQADLSTTHWTPARDQAAISHAKNELQTSEDFAANAHDWSDQTLARIYRAYEILLAEQQGLDFDDLLLKMALLLRTDESLRAELEGRYTHLLVDEYQDTNRAQYEIARRLTMQNRNLCVTGDPDQSIYGWRGADIRNILNFEQDYPDARVVRLEQNYRSSKRVLSAAGRLITFNRRRKEKALWTENPEGGPVRVACLEDGKAEARFVADEILARRMNGRPLRDIAVFYRINALSRSVEEELLRAGIAYQVARGVEFYSRREIKDTLAYLRVMVNPADETSLLRIINTPPRGIGPTTIKRLQQHAIHARQRLFDVVCNPGRVPGLGRTTARMDVFAQTLRNLASMSGERPRAAVEAALSQSGLRAALQAEAHAYPERLENAEELVNAAAGFEQENPDATLTDFLQHVSLVSDVDAVNAESGCVTLMTLHAAKGLEFPVVYIIGLEDGLLPMLRNDDSDDEEEERRLCFVGMTRAMEELTLTHATYRTLHGRTERRTESVFLSELPQDEIDWLNGEGEPSDSQPEAPARPQPAQDLARWEIGTLVRHPAMGLARVQWISPGGQQTRIGLRFPTGEQKTFILEYAKLERVDFDEVD